MPVANVLSQVTVFADPGTPSLPLLKYVDWKRTQTGLSFDEAYSERTTLAPGASKVYESILGADFATPAYDIDAAPGKAAWYLFTSAAAFTSFVTSIGSVGATYTFIPQTDDTLVVQSTHFSTLVVGQTVYFAGSDYGDAGPWSSANQGMWQVISTGATQAVFARIDAADTVGAAEAVACANADDIQVVSSSAVPRFALISGPSNIRVFAGLKPVVAVTKNWFALLTEATFFPQTVSGATFTNLWLAPDYLNFVRVEVDQVAKVELDAGDPAITNTIQVMPQAVTEPTDPPVGWFESLGFYVSLKVTNLSANVLTANVIFAYGA